MKKEFLIHFIFLIPLFIFISIKNSWLALNFYPFWIGGAVGMILPYIDHLVYIYFLKPQELTSQRVSYYVEKKSIFKAFDLLADTAHERSKLIFHSVIFQGVFTVLTFLIVSSSNSLVGRGIVLGFYLHLVIDQLQELMATKTLFTWFKDQSLVPQVVITPKFAKYYFGISVFLLLVFSFLF